MDQVQLVQERGWFKIIEMYIGDVPYFICRPDEAVSRTFHPIILEEVLNEMQIPHDMIQKGSMRCPDLAGESYRVVGMGSGWDNGEKIRVGGRSLFYGIRFDPGFMEKVIQPLVPERKLEYSVLII
jgi:hypothetical protein